MHDSEVFPPAQLGTLVEILDSQRIPLSSAEREKRKGDVPYYGANGLVGNVDRALFNEPLILMAEDGGNFDDFRDRPIAYRIDGPSWVNNHAHILRTASQIPQSFIYWSIVHKDIRRYIAGGTRAKLNQSELKEIEILVPNPQEAEQIAQILDTLDTQIQKTVALIAKLEKIKGGLLHDLLTRGIDQNGQLRPTPEQTPELYKESALGLIPKEWEVEYLSNLSESGLLNGVFKQPSRVGHGVTLINVADLYKGNSVNLEACERFDASPSERSKYSARGGDIFFTRSSLKLEGIAHCNWLNQDVEDNSVVYECHVIRIRPVRKVDPHFLVSWCQSQYARRHFMANAKQVTMTTISQDGIASLNCPVPPLPEQKAAFERVKKLEDRIENESLVLQKLRLEKSGLMDDLLTGHVRVTSVFKDEV
jgi:type I restriction enzyme S subunit